jgi:hypothetical protein
MDTYFIKTSKNIESPSLGPFSLESFSATQLDADDLILKNGNIIWNKASELQELRPFIRKTVIEERSRQTENQQYDRKIPQDIPSLRTPAFTDYIKSKKNLLIIWFLFHGFALFVNVCDIGGDITSQSNPHYISGLLVYDYTGYTYLFTNSLTSSAKAGHFWPFVKFYDKYYGHYQNGDEYPVTMFNGIFYQYDISEFLAYTILIFLILYIRWNSNYPDKAK